MVRAPDFKSGGRGLKALSDHLAGAVPRKQPRSQGLSSSRHLEQHSRLTPILSKNNFHTNHSSFICHVLDFKTHVTRLNQDLSLFLVQGGGRKNLETRSFRQIQSSPFWKWFSAFHKLGFLSLFNPFPMVRSQCQWSKSHFPVQKQGES